MEGRVFLKMYLLIWEEINLTYNHVKNCDFVYMYAFLKNNNILQGDGPKLVRELFRVAEEHAPSIVFIDEIDAVGTKR